MRRILMASALLLSGCGLSGCGLWGGGEPPAAEVAPAQASASQESGQLKISHFTWKAFENYKYWLTPVVWSRQMGEGYFAVAQDGRSWGLTGCSANACAIGTLDSMAAVEICQQRSGGVPCVVFAHRQEILIPYTVVAD